MRLYLYLYRILSNISSLLLAIFNYLGSQKQAEICVRELLESVDSEDKTEMLNSQDQDGCTALYLAAKHKNLEASKLLLLDGSAFDIK